jgi:gem associated protein 2
MFSQKPCLPVSMARKRKLQVQGETADSEHDDTFGDPDTVLCKRSVNSNNRYEEDDDDDGYYDGCDDLDTEMNATRYLYRVREEARQLPDIWSAVSPSSGTKVVQGPSSDEKAATSSTKTSITTMPTIPIKVSCNSTTNNLALGSIASLQYLTSHRTRLYPPPTSSHIPLSAKGWVDQTLADFSKLRQYLENCKGIHNRRLSERQPVPPMKDYMAWFTFCIGRRHVYPRDDNEIASAATQPTPEPSTMAWEINLPLNGDGYTPSTSLLLQMDQVMVRRVLGHMTRYIDRVSDDNRQNGSYIWIYALLARLEKPIHRDDAVTLFTLLKRLTLLRHQIAESTLLADPVDSKLGKIGTLSTPNSKRAPDDDNVDLDNNRQYLATLNTLIAIIGLYFEQGGNYAQIMDVPSPA